MAGALACFVAQGTASPRAFGEAGITGLQCGVCESQSLEYGGEVAIQDQSFATEPALARGDGYWR